MPADVEESSRDDAILEDVYRWIDSIPLSRPKKNIGLDFSDCVLVAETIHHYKPNLISLHNFPATSSFKQKVLNWETLNMKVLRKFGLKLSSTNIDQVASVSSFNNSLDILLVYTGCDRAISRSTTQATRCTAQPS
jgi:hypothetical protein